MTVSLPDHHLEMVLAILRVHPKVERAVVYGSRARGDNKPYSDIDLTLMGKGLDWRTVSDIAEALEESALPYFVDLSDFSTISNERFRAIIEREGVEIYGAATQSLP
ncbi:MAG: nucleotidyltransferase domain-containing protein [Candidatus Pacebacteria bacterium]|nr:nucleotidyltransferase domain-containing protein [Candidatus Paceibacterota bacterium]